jgi:hypothetical protein
MYFEKIAEQAFNDEIQKIAGMTEEEVGAMFKKDEEYEQELDRVKKDIGAFTATSPEARAVSGRGLIGGIGGAGIGAIAGAGVGAIGANLLGRGQNTVSRASKLLGLLGGVYGFGKGGMAGAKSKADSIREDLAINHLRSLGRYN